MPDHQLTTHTRRRTPRIPRVRRRVIYVTFILLVATGFAWLAVHFLANEADEMMPLQAWNMKIHGAAAWLVIAARRRRCNAGLRKAAD